MIRSVTRSSISWMLVSSFAAVYLIWGSTYLAIRVAVETIPPFLMLGFRFGLAGGLLFAWLRLRGVPRPSGTHWRTAAIVGGLLLCVGTGSVAWAEQFIPSGLAALLATTVPLWMVLLDWLWKRGARPTGVVGLGLVLGLVGVALLVDPSTFFVTGSVNVWAVAVVILGALAWSAGSIHSRSSDLPANPMLSTAMQMLTGGILLILVGLFFGEGHQFDVTAISVRSFLGWSYLLVFGSFIAFSAYVWLLRNSTPARVATYAYVNPVVAVLLGWALLDEPLTLRIAAAVVLLVSAVILITRQRTMKRPGAASLRTRSLHLLRRLTRRATPPSAVLARRDEEPEPAPC